MPFGDRYFGPRFFGNNFFGPAESGTLALSVRLLGATHDTTDGTGAKTIASFTPNDGERIYLFSTAANGSDASGFSYPISGGQILGDTSTSWTRKSSVGTTRFTQCHEASYTAMARAMTLSITPGTSITGMNMVAVGVAGFPKIRQIASGSGSSGVAPTASFSGAVASTSVILGFLYVSVNAPGSGITVPSGFTSLNDAGYNTPNGSTQTVYLASGHSGSSVTWGSTASTNWNCIIVELEQGRMSDMNHYRAYGANTTEQVLRIQYPSGGYDGTKGYVVGPPSNQWNWTFDVNPQNNVLADVLLRGFPVAFISYRKRGTANSPAQVQDFHAGLQYLITNAATYQLDTSKVAGFGISAGAHVVAMAALTGGEADVGGTNTPVGHIKAVYWQFGHNRARMISPFATQYGITLGRTAPCTAGSIEEGLFGTVPCSLASFDWISGDSGSLSTAKTVVYNQTTPGYWAGQWSGSAALKPKFKLWHGTADDQIPYGCTYNPKSGGTGHALDNGFHQDLTDNGFNSEYTLLAGEGHGGNAFQPSSNGSATNGAAVDEVILWMLTEAGMISSEGPMTPGGRLRRRSVLL